eukprot:10181350-Alexandrium_andersonii.AAC.1
MARSVRADGRPHGEGFLPICAQRVVVHVKSGDAVHSHWSVTGGASAVLRVPCEWSVARVRRETRALDGGAALQNEWMVGGGRSL